MFNHYRLEECRCSDGVSDDIRQGSLLYSSSTLVSPMFPAFNAPQWNADDTRQQQQNSSNDERRWIGLRYVIETTYDVQDQPTVTN